MTIVGDGGNEGASVCFGHANTSRKVDLCQEDGLRAMRGRLAAWGREELSLADGRPVIQMGV